ncbi:hypothetical protein JG687_00017574, partial [Phytophthora cactorum]
RIDCQPRFKSRTIAGVFPRSLVAFWANRHPLRRFIRQGGVTVVWSTRDRTPTGCGRLDGMHGISGLISFDICIER